MNTDTQGSILRKLPPAFLQIFYQALIAYAFRDDKEPVIRLNEFMDLSDVRCARISYLFIYVKCPFIHFLHDNRTPQIIWKCCEGFHLLPRSQTLSDMILLFQHGRQLPALTASQYKASPSLSEFFPHLFCRFEPGFPVKSSNPSQNQIRFQEVPRGFHPPFSYAGVPNK